MNFVISVPFVANGFDFCFLKTFKEIPPV